MLKNDDRPHFCFFEYKYSPGNTNKTLSQILTNMNFLIFILTLTSILQTWHPEENFTQLLLHVRGYLHHMAKCQIALLSFRS